MLLNWLRKVRQKPKHIRDNIAFGIAGSFTAIVLIVWIVFVPGKIMEKSRESEVEKGHVFSTLFSQIKEQVAGVKEALPDATSTESVIKEKPVVLSASSSWALSSSTIETETIKQEVPIIVVPTASGSVATSTPINP